MNKAGKKQVRLLFASACLLLVSACDLSGGGSVATPLPEPVVAPSPVVPAPTEDAVFDNVATFVGCDPMTTSTCTSDASVSKNGIAEAAIVVDRRIGELKTGTTVNITVTVTGNADRRCSPSNSTECANGKYLKAGSGGTSDKNKGWSASRAITVMVDLKKELASNPGKYKNYGTHSASVKWREIAVGETYAVHNDTVCRKTPSTCRDDRASDIVVSSDTPPTTTPTTSTTTTSTTTTSTTTTSTTTTSTSTTTTSTTTTTTTTTPPPSPSPPPPPPAAVTQVVRAFQNAQQNSDQRIVVKAATLVCAECQQPPSSSSGVMYGWTATLDFGTVSFALTPPAGYATPRDYRITSNPNGKSALSDQTAVLRFYTATRSGAPYRYLATANVSYTMRLWRLEGTTLTYVRQESRSASPTLTCSPASCSFGVLGSNIG